MSARKTGTHPCRLCGIVTSMTRTHIPAQSAGNTVDRSRLMAFDDTVERDPSPRKGGLYVFGLCGTCNGSLQSSYDSAYAYLAWALRDLWVPTLLSGMPTRHTVPDVECRPGAVARTVLISCFAMSPQLRIVQPDLAAALVRRDPAIHLPPDLRLYLALMYGRHASIAGPVHAIDAVQAVFHDRQVTVDSAGSIYFPPLAWQLAPPLQPLLRQERWVDVSSWLTIDVQQTRRLHTVCRSVLPLVRSPADPARSEEMILVSSSEIAEVVFGVDVPRDILTAMRTRLNP